MVNDWFLNDNIINTLLVSNPLFLIGLTILIALLITAFYWFTGHEFHEELNYSISYPFEVYSSCYFNNSIISLWFCNVMSFCSLISQWQYNKYFISI